MVVNNFVYVCPKCGNTKIVVRNTKIQSSEPPLKEVVCGLKDCPGAARLKGIE